MLRSMLLGSAACTSIAPVLIRSVQAQVTEINTGLPTAQAIHPLAAPPSVGGVTLDMISLAGSGLGRGVVVDSSGSQVGYVAQRLRSATKTDTPLIDTPQAISVVTEAQIRDQNVQSIGEALRYVPGVAIAQGEGHRDEILIRGQRTTADFFVNGIRDDARYYRDLYNTQRIEVLKGPNAMTFGRGGGVVNRVLKEADGATSFRTPASHRRTTRCACRASRGSMPACSTNSAKTCALRSTSRTCSTGAPSSPRTTTTTSCPARPGPCASS
ncbi:TonB-dependent receptor plug domain-containing protein [Methylorubrum populi]